MARYAERLLADGERIVFRSRQHGIAIVATSVAFWVLLAAAVIFFLLGRLIAWVPLDWLALFGLLGALARLAWRTTAWWFQDFLVTDRRVIKVEGIANRQAADSSLRKVDDAVLRQGVLGRLLGYGDLAILAEGEASVDGFRMLARPTEFKKAMLEAKYALERVTGGPLPGPAVRIPVPAGATPARAMTLDEVVAALARLADLRDRGAISAADYDAKKAEFLARI